MDWLNCLHAFVQVAELKGFSAAAQSLMTNSSDITKRIQWLEQQLETALFVRTTRKVSLTDAGQYLLNRAKPFLNEWQDLQTQILNFHAQPQGTLKICTPPQVSRAKIISHCLAALSQAYPMLYINIVTTSEPIHLIEKGIDIFIGADHYILDPASTVGKPLFDFKYQLYASPRYLKQSPPLKSLADLSKHRCLIYRDNREWELGGKTIIANGNFCADSGDALMSACALGNGIIRIPDFMVQELVDKNSLVHVLPDFSSKKQTLKIYYTKQAYQPRKIQIFLDVMKKSVVL